MTCTAPESDVSDVMNVLEACAYGLLPTILQL